MGWWKCQHGVIGDWPADLMDAAFKKIEDAYLKTCGRLPTQGELANLIEFCSNGTLRPSCGDPKFSFSKAVNHEDGTPRAAARGNQGCLSGFNAPGPGKMANVNPVTGEHFGQTDAGKVIESQFKELQDRKEAGDWNPENEDESGMYGAGPDPSEK